MPPLHFTAHRPTGQRELEKEMEDVHSPDFLEREAAEGSMKAYHALLDSVPDAPPMPGDELP